MNKFKVKINFESGLQGLTYDITTKQSLEQVTEIIRNNLNEIKDEFILSGKESESTRQFGNKDIIMNRSKIVTVEIITYE